MAKKTSYHWSGTCNWAKIFFPEEAFDKTFYSMDFYPKDAKTRKEVSNALPRNKLYEDDDGGFYFKLRAPEGKKPRVVDSEGEKWDSDNLIGNGSGVTVKVEVESFKSKSYGDVTRATLKAVRVDDYIKYERDDDSDDDNDESDDDNDPLDFPD